MLLGPLRNQKQSFSFSLFLLAFSLFGCGRAGRYPDDTEVPLEGSARFAVIGDYGVDTEEERQVSQLVKSWAPEFIITLGDNNYPSGEARTIDANIGRYYAEYIGGYHGSFGPGSAVNRFFPSVGNHDLYGPEKLKPYLDYFPELPGNRRYYDVNKGIIHLFAVNSDERGEPDGAKVPSVQTSWLQERMASSTACWKLVYFHHTPHSSGEWAVPSMRWPFKAWGADVVMAGHDHVYERLEKDGIPYFINGLGGANRFSFKHTVKESRVRFRDDWGAMLVTIAKNEAVFEFHTIHGQRIDRLVVPKRCE
jgi:hypothetical protein